MKKCHAGNMSANMLAACHSNFSTFKNPTFPAKSVSSNKSAKTIKSLTKQVKILKKPVTGLQAHCKDSNDNSSLSSVE
jgi:hypothetical protein